MKRQIRLFAWLLPAVVVVFACSTSQLQSVEGTVAVMASAVAPTTGADTPAAAATSASSSSKTEIFKDDFSDKSNGWDSTTSDSGTTDYSDGKYLISISEASFYRFATPSSQADTTDVSIEVDVLKSDDVQHDMGLICRYQDTKNFYYLLISSDGYFAIGKFLDGNEELIGSTEMRQDNTGAIHTGTADNHLRADCVGDTLTLYANGAKLFQAQDTDFAKGNVGLIAASYDDTPVTVYFDNFVANKA